MCHERHGIRRGLHGYRRLSREEWLRRLEEHQRDLEQEIADADLIGRPPDEPAPSETVSV